ncbi:growth hormone receptor-like isoform X2 [Megalops cyprinoides]|nr:growth hormone receptor-like isoform X2 [Megalops cyprinoides]
MAATLLVIPLLMGVGSLGSLPPSVTSQAPRQGPHFTGCLSRDLETFRCWWSTGSFRNLTEPAALRVFYQRESSPREREECPHYSPTVPFECFFDRSHTSIWRPYCLWLLSRDKELTYDSRCFSVEDIVHPDPPVGLNWTLLNASHSGLHFDVMLRWEPPPSADVKRGWMSLLYEVQFRQRSAPRWQVLDPQQSSRRSLYGLRTDSEYEVRVRCRMSAFDNFGEFSNVTLIAIPHVPSKESRVPVMVVLIFGTVGVGILLMLIIFSQQQKLMVILLPPVPAPKIKGIDPELLKKGKLDQLSSMLSSQHSYRPGAPPDDPWVEHIELDFEELSERRSQSDTQRLLHQARTPCPYDLGLKDDDSGRASCCEADLPDPDAPGHPRVDTAPPSTAPPPVHAQHSESSWAGKDFYTQVREVTGEGVVMLAPGPEGRAEEGGEEWRKKEQFQLVVGGIAGGDYTTETDARRISADLSPGGAGVTPWEGVGQRSPALPADTQLVSDYTLVQDVNEQQNLLLNPASLHPTPSKPHPLPAIPIPAGYLSPDLLASIAP